MTTQPTGPKDAERDRATRLAFMRIWCVIGGLGIAAVALKVMGVLSSALMFLFVGCFTAFVASPIVNWLQRRRVPRGAAAILAIIFVFVVVVVVFSLLVPMVVSQVVELLSDLPSKISQLGTWFTDFENRYELVQHLGKYVELSSIVSNFQSAFTQIASGLLGAIRDGLLPMVNNVASTLFVVFLGFVLAYWLACDYPKINDEICKLLGGGGGKAMDYRLMIAVVSQSVGGYLRSMVINSTIQGFLAFVGFWLVGLPYAGTMGVLSGVLNFILVVGPSISAAIAVILALFYSPVMAFWTLVAAVVSQNVTDNLIAPKINQSTMSVHPALSLTALVIGSTLGGTLGMVIAIPLCAVVKSLFIFYYEGRTGRQIVSYDGALFRGTPYHDDQGNPVPAYDALGDDSFGLDSEIVSAADMPAATAAPKPKVVVDSNIWDLMKRRGAAHKREKEEEHAEDDDGR